MNTAIPIWQILAAIAAVAILTSAWGWFSDQYEVAGGRRIGFRLHRRWYGTRARVILRADAGEGEPERFKVLAVDAEDSGIPWLKVGSVDFDEDHLDEDDLAEPFWAPVTDFAPEAVRRLHPWIFRYRWLRLPALFAYVPLARPAGFPGDGA
jgi:hypothetical protein